MHETLQTRHVERARQARRDRLGWITPRLEGAQQGSDQQLTRGMLRARHFVEQKLNEVLQRLVEAEVAGAIE
ncbi:hypothetical protein [Salinicola tamaricis]|uniref:hypothetical protein n=1 Tax=Salinicola tamaricis TaxID=1771309 RepID=UPI001F5DD9B0|nr:hypothetical protein [Salinicola tamaricis]